MSTHSQATPVLPEPAAPWPRQNGQLSDDQIVAIAKIRLAAYTNKQPIATRPINARVVEAPRGIFRRRKESMRAWRVDDERQLGLYLLVTEGDGQLYVSDQHVGNGIFRECRPLEDFVRLNDTPPEHLLMMLAELKKFALAA